MTDNDRQVYNDTKQKGPQRVLKYRSQISVGIPPNPYKDEVPKIGS